MGFVTNFVEPHLKKLLRLLDYYLAFLDYTFTTLLQS